jgi:hypothetical protein
LRIVCAAGSVLSHPLFADRAEIHSARRAHEHQERHREAEQTRSNRNPRRDRDVHRSIMPHLIELRNIPF